MSRISFKNELKYHYQIIDNEYKNYSELLEWGNPFSPIHALSLCVKNIDHTHQNNIGKLFTPLSDYASGLLHCTITAMSKFFCN